MSKKILYTFEVWSGGYGGGYETRLITDDLKKALVHVVDCGDDCIIGVRELNKKGYKDVIEYEKAHELFKKEFGRRYDEFSDEEWENILRTYVED